jgi:hypothetical protein
MGNSGSSASLTQIQSATSNALLNAMVSHTQNCSAQSTIAQNTTVTAGDNSTIVMNKVSINAQLQQTLTCLMTASFNASDIAQIQNQFKSNMSQSSIKFPDITTNKSNMSLQQYFVTNMVTNININSIMSSAQQANINQNLILTAGKGSSIIINETTINAALASFQTATINAVTQATNNLISSALASGELSQTQVNALQPIADVANKAIDKTGDVVNNALLATVAPFILVAIIIITIVAAIAYSRTHRARKASGEQYMRAPSVSIQTPTQAVERVNAQVLLS